MFDFRAYGNGIYAFDTGYIRPLVAAVHLLVENGRAAFVDTGINDTLPVALQALERLGLGPAAVDFVILTHIHLDHAGGAGAMMAHFPNARLLVHPRGARHMVDPAKLVAGVSAVYGKEYVERMYGQIVPIAAERIIEAQHESVIDLAGRPLLCLDTPGHARHHICLLDRRTGGMFTGDMFGLSYREMDVGERQFIFPTTTPTQFEYTAMRNSIDLLMSFKPSAMYLTHYGQIRDIPRLQADLLRRLDALVAMARQEKDAGGERHERLKSRLTRYLLDEAHRFGCHRSDDELLEQWETDLELNTQGLEVWLDSL